jgi:drug/metabolite transporter (DMT)-like permease
MSTIAKDESKSDTAGAASARELSLRAFATAMAYGVAYITAATAIIMLNKYLLSVTAFHYPIVLCSLGVVCGWALSLIAVHTGRVDISEHKDITLTFWAKNVLPIGLFQGVTLALGNMAYFHLTLSFLQIMKALSPAVLFFILYITGLDKWHTKVALAVLIIIGGTLMASLGEMNFTWIGFALILGAEVFEAFKNAAMQFLLANKKFSMWAGMYYISPASLVFLSIAAAIFEFKDMAEKDAWGMMADAPHMFIAAGFLGFVVNFCSLGVIKHIGSLTLKVLAQLRSIIIITFGVIFYHDVVEPIQIVGYSVALVGFAGYNYAKIQAKEEEIEDERRMEEQNKPLLPQ